MKKMLFVAAFAVFGMGMSNAQEENTGGYSQGDLFVTGSIGISTESTGDRKENTLEFAPSVGYFVSDNIAIGLGLGLSSSTFEEPGVVDFESTTIAIEAAGRYYVTPSSQFSLFGQLSVAYLSVENEQGAFESNTDGFGLGIAPGVSYFISNNFALEATVGILSYSSVELDGASDSTNSFDLGLNFTNVNLGLVYKFN